MTKRQFTRWRTLERQKQQGTASEVEVRECMALRAKHPEIAVADLTGELCYGKLQQIQKAVRPSTYRAKNRPTPVHPAFAQPRLRICARCQEPMEPADYRKINLVEIVCPPCEKRSIASHAKLEAKLAEVRAARQ